MTNPHELPQAVWQDFLTRQCARTPLVGTVTAVLPFGAFVRLDDAVDGLLHRSEWSSEPEVGSEVSVRILALDLDKRRVSLAQV
jgi:small subunit ribosomal protein S1